MKDKRKKTKEKENSQLIEMLEELARRLSIDVRFEPIKSSSGYSEGGLCKVKGRYILIINPNASKDEKIKLLKETVKRFNLGSIYIKPALRSYLEDESPPL